MLMLQILNSLPDCCSSNITLSHYTRPTILRTKYRFLYPIASSSSFSYSSSYSECSTSSSLSRRKLITDTAAITLSGVLSSLIIGETHALAGDQGLSGWERIYLPIDIAFVPDDPTHYAGENWKRIPLSTQLPGDMKHQGKNRKNAKNHERPRFFDSEAKSSCWTKAQTVPGRHPDRWRKDAAGNIVAKRFHGCQGCLCFEYDHIIPFSKGGPSVAGNCQILQARVNRSKADKTDSNINQLKGYSCNIQYSNEELDVIEMAVYGNVIRPGNMCRVGSINELDGRDNTKGITKTCKFQ